MGEAAAQTELLEYWIPNGFDLYVINTQECEYSPRKGFKDCEKDWFDVVTCHMGIEYVKLAGLSLIGIRLVVLVRREHFYKISQLKTDTMATGIGNIIGNKGGVAISFKFNETSFCFIGSHLAARQGEVENRNANFREIIRGAKNVGLLKGVEITSQFHHIIWMGDLNYRIDIDRSKVLSSIKEKDFSDLLANDQLNQQRKMNAVFCGFQEAPITFPPTYRYNRGIYCSIYFFSISNAIR